MTEKGYSMILSNPKSIEEFVKTKIESKRRWYLENRDRYAGRHWKGWHEKVIEIFYRDNLGVEIPGEGEVVYMSKDTLIVDLRSPCPILDSCIREGANTIQVCSTLYHTQYQVLLSLIDSRLCFARDYSRLRPMVDHCREIIHWRKGE
jgi:hypothetical protein